jgi:hypothetical protein
MKKQYPRLISPEEMSMISGELNPEEVFVLSFLRGFNRDNMKEWSENDLAGFENNYLL